jgi:hypothetical protein
MRLAKLCITLALAAGGWHAALASALCARRADCHASASTRAAPAAGHVTQGHANADAAADHSQTTAHANADPANRHGHCGPSAESPREVARAAPHDAENETAHGGDEENASSESVANLRAPGSSCEHCVGRQTGQPARLKSVAPVPARDSQAAPVPAQHLVTLPQSAPRPRFAPTEHSPPRGRPAYLLNSVLLI